MTFAHAREPFLIRLRRASVRLGPPVAAEFRRLTSIGQDKVRPFQAVGAVFARTASVFAEVYLARYSKASCLSGIL